MDMSVSMATAVVASTTTTVMAMAATSTAATTAMSMGESDGCKLSMLLNWHTIDACFLSSAFHIRSSFTFFLTCLASFLLVISLEFLRRSQRALDRYLRSRKAHDQEKQYTLTEGTEEKLLGRDEEQGSRPTVAKERLVVIAMEQLSRGAIHTIQFAVSYIVMLLFMYSNGYIIFSILFGSLVGFALFTKDTLESKKDLELHDGRDKTCC